LNPQEREINVTTYTTAGRWLAIAAGLAFTGGALTILLHDVIARGQPWTMAHTLAVLTVAGVILAGELAREAWGSRQYGACLGFWLAVGVGTGLVVYNSVGRQAEASDTSTLSVEDRNDQRAAIKVQLAGHQKMLDEEQDAKAAEIKRGGCGKVCLGYDASITVYQAAVAGDEAKLKELGAPEPVAPKAEKFAEMAALFGANKAQALALATLLEPFLYTLLFEYGSIIAWGYVFRSSRRRSWAPTFADSMQTSFPPPGPLPPLPPKPRRRLPANVVPLRHPALAAIEKAGKPVSNRELANLMAVSEGEASKRWQEVRDHLDVCRQGKALSIALKA
jgi:hypothetical protein